jgi:hypothetical protein
MKVLLVGDSHTQVTWDLLRPHLEGAGHEVVGQLAKPGWGARKYLSSSELSSALKADPDAVIVGLGGNNHELSEGYRDTVKAFLPLVGHPTRRIVWIGPATSDMAVAADTGRRHEWTADWLAENLPSDIVWIDSRPHTMSGHRSDGVHFERSGYRAWVDGVAEEVKQGLSRSPLALRMRRHAGFYAMVAGAAALTTALLVRRRRQG